MPWYKAGTVSVAQNSNAVTGTGTSFIANSRVGDAFLGPDGRWYEVTNIASNTAMSISPNYLGATAGSGTYALAPMQGYVKDSADALRALVNQFGTQLAALGTTGNYDILPIAKGGTGVAAASNAALLAGIGAMPIAGGAYTPSFNSLRTIVGAQYNQGQGGYMGWNDPSDGSGFSGHTAFTSNKGGGVGGFTWRSVNTDNTQGGPTMTYSYAGELAVPISIKVGGVNIVERGTNSNGEWVKYYDGTLICWKGNISYGPAGAGSAVSVVVAPPVAFLLSQPVIIIPNVQYALTNDSFNVNRFTANMGSDGNITLSLNTSVSQVYRLSYYAIGRWK